METSRFAKGIYQISEWIMRFSVINLLWLLFNLPITYLALHVLLGGSMQQVQSSMFAIAFVMPFVFFPATAAMFGVTRKWIMGDTTVPLLQSFWQYYRKNYVRSLLGGLMIVPIWLGWLFNYFFVVEASASMLVYCGYLIGSALLSAFTVHFFSITVHLHMNLFASLKNSLFVSLGKPVISFGIVLANGLLLYIGFGISTFFLTFFMGSLSAYICFAGFYRIYSKAMAQLQNQELD